MTSETMSPRWPSRSSDTEVSNAEVIHARFTKTDDLTVCERGGGETVPYGSVTLILDDPMAPTAQRPVDCRDCLEWLHA